MSTKRFINENIRVFTWHIHGSYLYYLTHAPCIFYLPKRNNKDEGYGGRSGSFPWPDNVIEVDAEEVKGLQFDCILFQSRNNYLKDQYEILSAEQRELPKIYLEHDPPREVPTDTKHIVDHSDVLIVHVTHFNNLMWDNNNSPSIVIEHGVVVPEAVQYSGELNKGIVIINGIAKRGRRLGLDIFEKIRQVIPLDIAGMGSELVGGLGEIPITMLHQEISKYRFFFNPIRYTSMGLAVCEAMMSGMPVIGLATTEMPVVIENGVSGYIHTNIDYLISKMQSLIQNPQEAKRLSAGAKMVAEKKFNINRFASDWIMTFEDVIKRGRHRTISGLKIENRR